MILCALLFGSVALPLYAQDHAPQSGISEYEAKAAFVFKLPEFVTWPKSALPDNNSLVLGVVGSDKDSHHFMKLDGKMISIKGDKQTRRLIVKHSKKGEALKGINILYVCDSAKKNIPGMLKYADPLNILTIGESSDFLDKGGMIEFFINDENRIRFSINNEKARKNNIRLDSQLLQVAEERK